MTASIFRQGIFDDQVAVVTGGGSGIGLRTALTLAHLGARVAICGRNRDRLDQAQRHFAAKNLGCLALPCDIREPQEIDAFVDRVGDSLGNASVLVNNAGGQFVTRAETLSRNGWDAVVRNNLHGTFYVTQAVATRHMIGKRGGRIVNVLANIARGFPTMVHTGAARAGVENLTKTLAIEWAGYNVQVNAVAPGVVQTEAMTQYPPEYREACRRRTPMKRFASPSEVAQLIVYLASDAAHFVTGECWYIDGGAHLWGDHWAIADEAFPVPPLVADLDGD